MTHTAFDTYVHGKFIERVYYPEGHTAEAVRYKLVSEEGYPAESTTVHLAAKVTE